MTKKYFFRGDICDGFENSDFVEIAGNPHKKYFFCNFVEKSRNFCFLFLSIFAGNICE
jgi:hypothetical protein